METPQLMYFTEYFYTTEVYGVENSLKSLARCFQLRVKSIILTRTHTLLRLPIDYNIIKNVPNKFKTIVEPGFLFRNFLLILHHINNQYLKRNQMASTLTRTSENKKIKKIDRNYGGDKKVLFLHHIK